MKFGERLTLDGTLNDENMTFLKQLDVNNLMVGVGAAAWLANWRTTDKTVGRGAL